MSKGNKNIGYTFTLVRENGTRIESYIAIEHVTTGHLLEVFEDFLKGCGFCFEGQIDIVSECDCPACNPIGFKEDNEPPKTN